MIEQKYKGMQETINPYLTGGKLLLSRLMWDLHPYSWICRKRIRAWKDRYSGKKAIILCNGPSLNKVNFDELQKHQVFTFGLNKINLLFDRTDFRPSVIVAVNPYVIQQNAGFFNQTKLPLFIDAYGVKFLKLRHNVHFLHSASAFGKFARDCSISIYQGATVTYVAMQLAFHMGFAKIALVGCDHNFSTKGPPDKVEASGKTDPNHFDSNYFANGEKWQLPDITRSELYYQIAGEIFEGAGRTIVNCTQGGKLELFRRQKLSDFFEEQ
ncbi:MAG: 6-hydroxymethylpterin diphosphokinase MptE-like protein [Dissulfuribacterales bacterium]